MDQEIVKLTKTAQTIAQQIDKVRAQIGTIIVGQEDVVEKFLIALVANGHVLIEGVPGLAKTLLIRTLSETLSCAYVRLQFTPDLLPADITGTKIYNQRTASFDTEKGPVFTNFVLADEINRAPPKVQSALLEAMQERQVSIQGDTSPLPDPFIVLATQNPIESEGTYNLPEAQLDRFMFKLLIGYPTKAQEKEIIMRFTEGKHAQVAKVLNAKAIRDIQGFNKMIYADDKIKSYVAEIVDATRNPDNYDIKEGKYIEFGASPRASLNLILAAKARAMINGRGFVQPEDVQGIAHEVLRHRILLTYEAEVDDVTSDNVITALLEKVKVP